ncbi:hypothetical protein, partial [Weissella bombi]|uniref:hypothetical protein n=1 Tax=Weissella bombi TaxID=1505725 RepID=UPI003AF309E2
MVKDIEVVLHRRQGSFWRGAYITHKVVQSGSLFILQKIGSRYGMGPWYRNVEASIIGKLDAKERKEL